jgi:hypothetical protein
VEYILGYFFIQIEVEKEMEILIKKNQDSADKKSGAPGLPSSQEEPKVLTNEDTIFDQSLSLLKGAAAKIPKLDLFDEKITELENKEAEIAGKKAQITGKKAVHDIGWLRINVQPLKERLGIKVQTWMKVYTDFLYKQVKLIVANIKSFNKTIEDGIKKNPINDQDNKELLMSVMKTISQVKLVDNGNIVNVVNRTKAMVGVLKKHAIPMDDYYVTVIDTIFSNFKDISFRV